MKKLSVLSLCLHTIGYLFRRILSIITLTFSTLMRVSDEKAMTTCGLIHVENPQLLWIPKTSQLLSLFLSSSQVSFP